MDLDPYTSGTLPMDVGTYLEWKVENLESSQWNTFNILGGSNVKNWGFVLTGALDSENATEPLTLYHASNLTLIANQKTMLEVPVAVAGIHGVRLEITDSGDRTPALSSIHVAYCKAEGAVCPGIDTYPAVARVRSPLPSVRGVHGLFLSHMSRWYVERHSDGPLHV